MRAVILLSAALLAASAVPAAVQLSTQTETTSPASVQDRALATFNDRIASYMAIHNEVEASLPPQRVFEDPEDMFEALEAMRSGILAHRADARQGNIFTADVAAVIRLRLEETLAASNQSVDEVLAFFNEERLRGAPRPRINGPFPWTLGTAMWPTLLPALPALPEDLQYRFVDRDLVLIDVHADLVVDILPKALPAPRSS